MEISWSVWHTRELLRGGEAGVGVGLIAETLGEERGLRHGRGVLLGEVIAVVVAVVGVAVVAVSGHVIGYSIRVHADTQLKAQNIHGIMGEGLSLHRDKTANAPTGAHAIMWGVMSQPEHTQRCLQMHYTEGAEGRRVGMICNEQMVGRFL